MFSTAVGLLMNALEGSNYSDIENEDENNVNSDELNSNDHVENKVQNKKENSSSKKSIFDKWVDKFKEFLDNA